VNSELRDFSTLSAGVNPREYVLESAITSQNLGPDVLRFPNTPETWAARLGVDVPQFMSMVAANPDAWAHLRIGESKDSHVLTSSTIRALGLNARIRVPYVAPPALFLLAEDRVADAYTPVNDRLVRHSVETAPLRATYVSASEADIASLGVTADDWKRRI
jgi:hypothetical protein